MKILVLFGPDNYGGSFVVAENVASEYRKNKVNYKEILVIVSINSV